MTQTHMLVNNVLSLAELVASTKQMIRAEVTKEGRFKEKPPSGQWYIRKVELGCYRVVHNINRKVYSVSVGSKEQGLTVLSSFLTDVDFEVTIRKDNQPYDATFVFALNFNVD